MTLVKVDYKSNSFLLLLPIFSILCLLLLAQSAGAVEYTDCTSAKG